MKLWGDAKALKEVSDVKLCGSCLSMDEHALDSGIRYCHKLCKWVWPDERQYALDGVGRLPECRQHEDRDTLLGALAENERARKRLQRALEIHTGRNVGTVDDPRHQSPKKPRKKA